ncbi:MAG: hypothetical protein QM736_20345 [Vicinamibacterales bacterium]
MNLAVVGRNLFAARHHEFVPEVFMLGRTAAERAILVQALISR